MGILDALIKNPELIGNVAEFTADNPEIAKAAMSFLSSSEGSGGGLGEIVGALQSGGLAEQAGVSGSEASAVLAGILPQIVDKLSPDGQLPEPGGLDSMLGGLMGALGKK